MMKRAFPMILATASDEDRPEARDEKRIKDHAWSPGPSQD
jgi:hypothetical protein